MKRFDCSAVSFGWPTLPTAALVLRMYSAALTPTQPIPHVSYCTHAISEGVTTSLQNRSFPKPILVCSQNEPRLIWSCWSVFENTRRLDQLVYSVRLHQVLNSYLCSDCDVHKCNFVQRGSRISLSNILQACKMEPRAEDECRDDKVAQISRATVHGYFHPHPAHHTETKPKAQPSKKGFSTVHKKRTHWRSDTNMHEVLEMS